METIDTLFGQDAIPYKTNALNVFAAVQYGANRQDQPQLTGNTHAQQMGNPGVGAINQMPVVYFFQYQPQEGQGNNERALENAVMNLIVFYSMNPEQGQKDKFIKSGNELYKIDKQSNDKPFVNEMKGKNPNDNYRTPQKQNDNYGSADKTNNYRSSALPGHDFTQYRNPKQLFEKPNAVPSYFSKDSTPSQVAAYFPNSEHVGKDRYLSGVIPYFQENQQPKQKNHYKQKGEYGNSMLH